MKRLLRGAAGTLCALAVVCPAMKAQTVTVTGSNVTDSTGTPLASGTASFTPTDCAGRAISYRMGGRGQTLDLPVTATVTNGAFSITLPDTNNTNPQNVCFSVTVTDNVTGDSVLGSGYTTVQPGSQSANTSWCSGSPLVCNFDSYVPNITNLPVTTIAGGGATTFDGGTISGATTMANTLTLHADPGSALQAATKQYVDKNIPFGTVHIGGSNYTVTGTDGAVWVDGTATGPVTITLPGIGPGHVLAIANRSSYTVTLAATSGVSLNDLPSTLAPGQSVIAQYVTGNQWDLVASSFGSSGGGGSSGSILLSDTTLSSTVWQISSTDGVLTISPGSGSGSSSFTFTDTVSGTHALSVSNGAIQIN